MIVELRELRKTDRGLGNFISSLQARGLISKLVNNAGYICYDTEELDQYRKTSRLGRPPKDAKKVNV